MKITILFDEETISSDYKTGFGLSLLIDDTVIFDSGSDGEILLHNLQAMNITTDSITDVVVSHYHRDHIEGLLLLLTVLNNPNVYLCDWLPKERKKQIYDSGVPCIESSSDPFKIKEKIYSTGDIIGLYNRRPIVEQSLFLTYKKNHAALVCGCAHYKIADRLEMIQEKISYYLKKDIFIDYIIGGFHLKHESEKSLKVFNKKLTTHGIERITPLHCSGQNGKKYLQDNFSGDVDCLITGDSIEI